MAIGFRPKSSSTRSAVRLERARNPGAPNEISGELHVERRQRKSLVVDHLGRSATADDDDWPESGGIGDSGYELARPRTHNHWLHNHAGNARAAPCGPRPSENLNSGCTDRLVAPTAATVKLKIVPPPGFGSLLRQPPCAST